MMAYGQINADVIGTSVAGSNLGAGNATIMKNRLIDAGFTINQRGYVSGTALSAGTYAHDRFKAGAGGCTYTFTQLATGVPIVITITAGSLQQVIEGANIPDGGTFTLSWTGTAQARFNGGTYGSSPLAVTGLTAGANCTIEFNTGTCSFPQLEVGTSATGFEYRQYQQELALCQRYAIKYLGNSSFEKVPVIGYADSATNTLSYFSLPVPMRASPSLTYSAIQIKSVGATYTISAINVDQTSNLSPSFNAVTTGMTVGATVAIQASGSTAAYVLLSAEL
jgi:hypothetical protein